jgi:hypothetical protein
MKKIILTVPDQVFTATKALAEMTGTTTTDAAKACLALKLMDYGVLKENFADAHP